MSALCALFGGGWGVDLVGTPTWTLRTLAELDPCDPLADLRRVGDEPGWWAGALGYDIGRLLEPSARAREADGPGARDDRSIPALALARLDDVRPFEGFASEAPGWVGPFVSATGRAAYERDAARAIGLIHAGDCFQVNLAHRLSAPWEGDARAISDALFGTMRPAFGAHLEMPGCTALSVSPELFLRYDARTRRVETRPIKGTRPVECDPRELELADKDRAELAMITDLMRNDLGRVAVARSVRVETERTVDAHAGARGVRHTSSCISATLRAGVGPVDLLEVTFPPGSVTGAPKVRAMQIIDALEPVRRAFYCGCVFLLSPEGSMVASVAIRGLTLHHASGLADLSVGAGLVADSEPGAEWEETLVKARAIREAVVRVPPCARPTMGYPFIPTAPASGRGIGELRSCDAH